MNRLTYHPLRVATGSEDERGLLVMLDRRLVAILVRLDADFHGEQRGLWYQEAGFGACESRPDPFDSLEMATTWFAGRMAIDERELGGALMGPFAAVA